jgi:hypothetical protein
MSMDIESTNAGDASIMSTVEMMQSCTLRDSGSNAAKSEQAQDVDMEVDTPTSETTQANETIVGSPQHEHMKHKVRSSTPYPDLKHHILTTPKCLHATTSERKTVCKPDCAPKPQHKHLKHLLGVDAKTKAPAAGSSGKVVKASVQHGRNRPGLRPLPPLKRKGKGMSRIMHALLGAIEEESEESEEDEEDEEA